MTLDEVIIKLLGISLDVLKPACLTSGTKLKDNQYEIGALEYLRNDYEIAESDFFSAKHSALEQEFNEKPAQPNDPLNTNDLKEIEKYSEAFDLAKERMIEGKRICDLMLLEKARLDRGGKSLLELDAKPNIGSFPDLFTKESVAKWAEKKLGKAIPEWAGFNQLNNTYDGEGPPYSNALLEVLFDAMRECARSKAANNPHKPASLVAWLKETYGEKEPFRQDDISEKLGQVMFKIANFDR